MAKTYDADACRRKADQHWEMAGLARQDGDSKDAERHTMLAKEWDARARAGGYQQNTTREI